MALQLFARLFTFFLNQITFRIVSPQAFGTAAIQFELVLNTILFISREGVRNTLLRAWPNHRDTTRSNGSPITNLALLPLILGVPLAMLTSYTYTHIATEATRNQPYFALAIGIYATAAIIELLSEPMHNR